MGGDETGGEYATGGERHVLAQHDEHRGLERVGAAGHPQVRPGPRERPEHRVVGQCGHPRRWVDVEPEPPVTGSGGPANGIRGAVGLDDRAAERAGRQRDGERRGGAVGRADQAGVAARAVGEHLDVLETGTCRATRKARSPGRSTSGAVTRRSKRMPPTQRPS